MPQTPQDVLETFAARLELFEQGSQARIAELTSAVQAHPPEALDALEQLFTALCDQTADMLGAQMANAAGDDRQAQDDALDAADAWVTDNLSHAGHARRIAAFLLLNGLQAGSALILQALPARDELRVRIVLDVDYVLSGQNAALLKAALRRRIEAAIGSGLLTDARDEAQTESWSLELTERPNDTDSPDEDTLAQFMVERIESGALTLEDIPLRLARYGLMAPEAFVQEMRERMDHAALDRQD